MFCFYLDNFLGFKSQLMQDIILHYLLFMVMSSL